MKTVSLSAAETAWLLCGAAETAPLPAAAAGRMPERDSLSPPIDTRPDSRSRFKRARSDFRSAACWYRRLRSFSIALSMMRSSSSGTSGFTDTIGGGVRLRMASKTTAAVGPAKA